MSQYVQRATGVAKQAAEVFSKRVVPPAVEYYNATMAKNAQYVVKDPAAVDKLGKQLVYSNLAKLPVMVEGAQAEMNIVKQKWAGRMDLPMTEVGTAALFAGEVYAWFCVGEIVGRGGGLTGY
mmetsp:Transcript_8799/g.39678  ORF Transcript_8799/g.39678 Transcript_8799/m.39678 type:complete len:123 (-) Transcript_8799:1669-2037(-)